MRPIYKSLALAAMTLQVSLALNAETRDDESASTMALQAELLDSLRVELVAQNVSGARNLIESGECVIDGSNLTITLDTSEWTRGAMYRVQVLATFGTQTQVIYALNVTVPYYVAFSDTPQEYEDTVTVVSTITDVTEADLDGLALEETSQEIKAAITPISQAAEAYNVGKTQLAAAITSKGVETSPTESYPEMAEKVNAISQETYEINGGEMYSKQLFGSLETPNYWNLYEIMTQLLSDGRLVNYGGILLAEYYKGYDSLALSGAGAGGAYVVSDKDSDGNFIMYTNDTTHTWDTEDDCKGNRWVAYCFADAGHPFQITNTNTSPRSIHIGRHVGVITSLVNGRVSEIVVTDGNKLDDFKSGIYNQNWGKNVVVRNLQNTSGVLINATISSELLYIHGVTLGGSILKEAGDYVRQIIINCDTLSAHINDDGGNFLHSFSIVVNAQSITSAGLFDGYNRHLGKGCLTLNSQYINSIYSSNSNLFLDFSKMVITTEDCVLSNPQATRLANLSEVDINYFNGVNDKTKSVSIYGIANNLTCVKLRDGWCKPLNISDFTALTEENMYLYILQRLKQDEPDCGDGVTITLGSTNLAKLTSAESVQLLDDLTNIYGYTFA